MSAEVVWEVKIKKINIPDDKRVICISDIHGEIELFTKLLDKVKFCDDDILVLIGDLYLKGSKPDETLDYIVNLGKRENVFVVRGNCDWKHEKHQEWLDNLPLIIDSEKYTFVHGGLEAKPLEEQDFEYIVSRYAFMEEAPKFDKWVVTGHWPTKNYCHEVACVNPIANKEKRVIAIDGGNVITFGGQLNAFMIKNGGFSFESVDNYAVAVATHRQKEQKGTLNITWDDRFIDIIKRDKEFSVIRHIATGIELTVPTARIEKDDEGRWWCGKTATNHWPAVRVGDVVSVVESYSDRHFIKKDGVLGWISLETIE